jgi:ABC-2 type transport system permease protein
MTATVDLARATWIQSGRALRRSLRMPTVVIQGLAFPLVLMLLLLAGFREVVGDFDPSRDHVQRLVPMAAVTGAVFGGLANGAGLIAERQLGLLDRFRALPSPRLAPLTGRVLAEAARIALGTIVLVAVASIVGFRFSGGFAGAVAFVPVVVLYGTSFSWLVTALAVRATAFEQLSLLAPLFLVLLFFNTGFVPLEAFPGALQPVVRSTPHTAVSDALLGLSDGGPVAGPLIRTVLWSAAITGVCATSAVRHYAAATSRAGRRRSRA